MKKFLSLVLALVMTMSLVTISAGAAEYKDLTDKGEIQYEEAVAVLNRIGIITGYEDGSFRPETELTRGAAAKIIVSLMIGPEAASNLPNNQSPYPDVPAGHTFAGVISYCKTAGYISGYGDGTFKPANSLTGFAFAKMLLGALGYKSDVEGFTGTGWTMNVARLGNAAGLFNRLSFQGADSVNREQACQLALNTLKGTMVEYTGGMNVSNGDQTVVVNPTRTYVTSNQDYAKNIDNRKASNEGNAVDNHWTVEFGEEHFKDLRMERERSKKDDFGRPSNEWSYKKVTIGTYPVAADFTYKEQVTHNVADVTDAAKVRALELSSYKVTGDTVLHENGKTSTPFGDKKVGKIADYTDNGTTVEVYVSDEEADLITDVVVVKTQLMEIKRIGSDAVTLDVIKPNNTAAKPESGYNQKPIFEDVEKVEEDNDNYEFLKGLKVGDYVAVVPVTTDNTNYEVFKAYAPEVVEGKLTKVNTYGNSKENRQAVSVTVGGTAYKVALWSKDLTGITADKIKYTIKDVKLYLDEYGNALRIKGVGDTSDFMVIKGKYSTLVNGKILTLVEGWDIKGNELSLNVGTANVSDYKPGDLVRYSNKGATGSAEWVLSFDNVTDIATDDGQEIKASNVRIQTVEETTKYGNKPYITSGVKLIYVTFDGDDVDSIEVRTGLQGVSNDDLKATYGGGHPAQASLDPDDEEITAVVVKKESNDAISSNLLYIRDWDGSYEVDSDGKKIYGYTVAMMSADGLDEKTFIYSDKELDVGDFASYTAETREGFEPFLKLKEHTATQKTTSVIEATVSVIVNEDKSLVRLANYVLEDGAATNIASDQSADLGVGDEENVVSMARAKWLDLTGRGINSVGDLKDVINDEELFPIIKMIYNDNPDNDNFRTVSLVIIVDDTADAPEAAVVPDAAVDAAPVGLKLGKLPEKLVAGQKVNVSMTQEKASEDEAKTFESGDKVDITVQEVPAVAAYALRVGEPVEHVLEGTVSVVRKAVAAKEEGYVEATVTGETFDAAVAAGLFVQNENDNIQYDQVKAYTAAEDVSAENFATKVNAGLYTKDGDAYTAIGAEDLYVATTYKEAETQPTADNFGDGEYYTRSGDDPNFTHTKAESFVADTTYYVVDNAGNPDGVKFANGTTYYVATEYNQGTTYYTHQDAVETAVKGVYEITFEVPAYNFKIVSIAKQVVEEDGGV